jgi:hypothetical protein
MGNMRYLFQIISLGVLLLIGILMSIDSAETNIQKMQGIEGAPGAIQLTPRDDKLQINVLGQVVETKHLNSAKVTQVQQSISQGENLLSNFGNTIGSHMRYYSRSMLSSLFSWAQY